MVKHSKNDLLLYRICRNDLRNLIIWLLHVAIFGFLGQLLYILVNYLNERCTNINFWCFSNALHGLKSASPKSCLTQVLPFPLKPTRSYWHRVRSALTRFQLKKKGAHDKARAPLWSQNPFTPSETSVFNTENPAVAAPLQRIRP